MSINPFYLHGEELTPVRKLLFMKALAGGAPLNEYEATGNPLTFTTNVAKPLKSLVASFTPIQSGTGDPSPENVRSISGWSSLTAWHTGKNLLDVSQFTDSKVWWAGTLVNGYDTYKASNKISVVPNAKYTLKKSATGQNQLQYFDADGIFMSQDTSTFGNQVTTFTIPSDVYFIAINIAKTALDTAQLEVGNSASEYEAYSGTSFPVTFPALGKNLFDKNNVVANTTWWKGNRVESSGNNSSAKIPVIPGETYTLARTSVLQNTVCYFDSDGNYVSQDVTNWTTNPSTNVIPSGAYYVGFTVADDSLDSAMFVKGSSTGSYEPYNATVYGGSFDIVSGVLTKTTEIIDMGTLNWEYLSSYDCFRANVQQRSSATLDDYPSLVCEVYAFGGKNTSNSAMSTAPNSTIYTRTFDTSTTPIQWNAVYVKDTRYSDRDDLIEALTGKYLAYELAEPVTYQLTPQQVTALIGDNTIWSDANGTCEVTYLKKG